MLVGICLGGSEGLLVGKAETVVKNARPIVKIIEVTPMVFIFAICVSMTWPMVNDASGMIYRPLYPPQQIESLQHLILPESLQGRADPMLFEI